MGIAELLWYFILMGPIGMLIGQKKGRPVAGLVWALLLGPFGWLLVWLLGPDQNATKSGACPFCGGVVPANQAECNHCKNKLAWLKGKPFRPSRGS